MSGKPSRPSILLVDDEIAFCQTLGNILTNYGCDVQSCYSGEEAQSAFDSRLFDLVITDIILPGMTGIDLISYIRQSSTAVPIVVISGKGAFRDVKEAIDAGAFDYVTKPIVDYDEFWLVVRRALEGAQLEREKTLLETRATPHWTISEADDIKTPVELLPHLPGMREVLVQLQAALDTSATIMIGGPTGVGKEVLATYIHQQSSRVRDPFIPVNCAAIPESLVESELFGAEKGAFTGAVQPIRGKFAQAHKGTLFLDEVGELPLPSQAKVLRAVQEREITPLGSTRTLSVDVRIIAASNRSLEDEVAKGNFRSDLYYRLNVFSLRVPPLAERPEDILLLSEYLITNISKSLGCEPPSLSYRAREQLQRYGWPGNVRELRNIIERAVILHRGGQLDDVSMLLPHLEHPRDVPLRPAPVAKAPEPPAQPRMTDVLTLAEAQRQAIHVALEHTKGRVSGPRGAAQLLDVNPSTLRSLMGRLGMSTQDE